MAKEVVTRCDKCGETGEDVKTYTVRVDGKTAEVDLDDKHAKTVTVAQVFSIGRVLATSARSSPSTTSLEKRIRGVPRND